MNTDLSVGNMEEMLHDIYNKASVFLDCSMLFLLLCPSSVWSVEFLWNCKLLQYGKPFKEGGRKGRKEGRDMACLFKY